MCRQYSKFTGIPKMFTGETVVIPDLNSNNKFLWLQECCDCGLMHLLEIQLVDNKLEIKILMQTKDINIISKEYDLIMPIYK